MKVRGKTPTGKNNPANPLYKRKFPDKWAVGINDLTQPEAKTFLPPNCSIWRNNTQGANWL